MAAAGHGGSVTGICRADDRADLRQRRGWPARRLRVPCHAELTERGHDHRRPPRGGPRGGRGPCRGTRPDRARRLARQRLGEDRHPAGLPHPGHARLPGRTHPGGARPRRVRRPGPARQPRRPGRGRGRRTLAGGAGRHDRPVGCPPGAGGDHHAAGVPQHRRLGRHGAPWSTRMPWSAPAPRSARGSTCRPRSRWAASWSPPARGRWSSRTTRSWAAAAACMTGWSSAPGAVLGAGVILTGQSRLIDLTEEREIRGTAEAPLVVPRGRRGRAGQSARGWRLGRRAGHRRGRGRHRQATRRHDGRPGRPGRGPPMTLHRVSATTRPRSTPASTPA